MQKNRLINILYLSIFLLVVAFLNFFTFLTISIIIERQNDLVIFMKFFAFSLVITTCLINFFTCYRKRKLLEFKKIQITLIVLMILNTMLALMAIVLLFNGLIGD